MELLDLTGALDINIRKFIDQAKLVEEDGKKYINISFNKSIKAKQVAAYVARLEMVFKKMISNDDELKDEFRDTKIRSV